jgi:hypothetical protein
MALVFEEALSSVTEKILSFKPNSETTASTLSAMLIPECLTLISLRPMTLFSNSQSAEIKWATTLS